MGLNPDNFYNNMHNMLVIFLSGIAIGLANALQVITGFGNVVIALPFVAALLGLKKAVMVVTLIAYMLAIYLVITNYKHINIKKVLPILICMVPTLFIGIYVFRNIDPNLFKKLLAIFLIIVSSYNLYKILVQNKERVKDTLSLKDKIVSYTALLIGGIFQGAISSGGPLVVIYATKAIKDKKEFRASLCLVWFVLNTIIVSSYFYYGIESSTLYFSLSQIPFLIAGIYFGEKVHNRIDSRTFSIIVFALLIVTAIFMLVL